LNRNFIKEKQIDEHTDAAIIHMYDFV